MARSSRTMKEGANLKSQVALKSDKETKRKQRKTKIPNTIRAILMVYKQPKLSATENTL